MPGAVATLVVRITSDLAQFNAGMSKATSRLAATSTRWASLGSSLTKNLTLPILAIGGIAVAAAMEVGKGMRIIQQRTGETGKAAEELGKSFKTVLRNVPESAGKVAEAMSDLHIRTGLVGKPLEDLTTKLLNLARITKSDVTETTTNAARLFNNWAIATNDQGKSLDYLYGVTTKTGIPINTLLDSLTRFGPQLRGLGFNFQQSAALIGLFEKAGVNTSQVMMGMRTGLANLAKAGKDPATEFPKLITQIKNAGTSTDATRLACELFGTRAGPAMADAIRSGKVNYEDLLKTLRKSPASINKTAKDTMTLSDRFKILKNRVSLALQPLGKGIMDAIKSILPIFSKLATVVGWIASAFSKIPGPIRTAIVIFLLMLAAVGPVLAIGAKFMMLASNMMKAFKIIGSGFSALSSLFAMNPMTLIILAIVAVVIIAALLIKKYWKQIGPVLKKVWDYIKKAFDAVWPPIQRFLLAIWQPILAVFKVVWKAIVLAAKVIWGALKIYFKVLFAVIKLYFKVWVWVIRNIVIPVFKGIVWLIKVIWNAVAAYFRLVFRIWKGIWNIGIAALKLIWAGISRAWHAVIDPLIRTVKAVWNAVSRAWSYVWGGKDGKGGISGAIRAVWNALKKAWHRIIDPLIKTVKAVWNAVGKAWSYVWGGKSGKGGIKGVLTGVWNAIKKAWHKVIDPLFKVVKFIWNGIGKVWKTLWEGKSGKGGIKGVLTGVWDKIKKAWHAVIDPLKRVIKFIWNGIGAAWKKSWGFIFRVLEDAWGLIVRLWNDTIGKIPGLGKSEKPSKTGQSDFDKKMLEANEQRKKEIADEYKKKHPPKMHGGGLVPTTGDYTLKAREGVLNPKAMRSMGTVAFRQYNRGLAPAGGGGNITIAPSINFNSVSPDYDTARAERKIMQMMDKVARQGYHAGKLK